MKSLFKARTWGGEFMTSQLVWKPIIGPMYNLHMCDVETHAHAVSEPHSEVGDILCLLARNLNAGYFIKGTG